MPQKVSSRVWGSTLTTWVPTGYPVMAETPEVPAAQIAQEPQVLEPEGSVQPHLGAQRLHRFLARVVTEGRHGRVSRQDADDDKNQREHDEKDGDALEYAGGQCNGA